MSQASALTPLAASDGDAVLARRIARGERGAFEELMRRHNRHLYRLARATLRDAAEAEDALQESYLSAYRAMAGFRGESTLATWLSRLVRNECLGRIRRHARRHNVVPIVGGSEAIDRETDAMSEQPDPHTPDRALVRAQTRALLERKLDELPEAFRTVFVMRAVEEMSVEETAQCLDIPEATVRSRHFRARSLLRESLARELDLAERDVFEFGGLHCDRMVQSVMARLAGER